MHLYIAGVIAWLRYKSMHVRVCTRVCVRVCACVCVCVCHHRYTLSQTHLCVYVCVCVSSQVDTITDSSLDKWHACAHQLLCQTLHTACCCHATAAHVATSVLCAVTQHEDAATQAQIVHTVLGLMRDAAAWVAMCAASGGDASEAERHALRLQALLASITQVRGKACVPL